MRHTIRYCAAVLAFVASFAPALARGQSAQGQPVSQAPAVQRLSVDEAVRLALEQNLSLQVQRIEPQLQDLTTAQIRSAWTPNVTSTFTNQSSTSPTSSFFSGSTTNSLVSDRLNVNVGANQLLPWGGNYTVSWGNSRGKTNSIFDTPNPALNTSLSAVFNQPLLRNFKIDSTRQQLLVSKKNREMTDVQLQQTVLNTVRSVKRAYWDLAFAVANLKVQQQSLGIARESLKNNKSRVSIGTMAPIDIIEAEAEVARNEESVILAEASISSAEDALRQLIYDPKMPDFWNARFDLTDQPVFQAQTVDVEAAIKNAIARRTDLTNLRKSIEAEDINIRYFKNQILPDLNVQAGYGLAGQGGTDYELSDTFPPVPQGFVVKNYRSVLSEMFSNDFHNWSFSVSVGYPIGRSSAEGALARARLARNQSDLQLRNAELSVSAQVREVARTLTTNQKRVDATKASLQLAEKRLDAEQKKFQAGMSSNFVVIQAQRDLAAARNAELGAVLDFVRAQVDFETVQEAPLGGGGISLATAGSTGGNR